MLTCLALDNLAQFKLSIKNNYRTKDTSKELHVYQKFDIIYAQRKN